MDGTDIRAIRKARGMSQAELGAYLGLSRDYVGQLERGVAPVKPRTLTALRALGPTSSQAPPKPVTTDPMERLVERALIDAGIRFQTDHGGHVPANLDFYLPDFDVYLEVKRMHSPRISDQMARAPNVIAIQGEGSVRFVVEMLARGWGQ